VNARGRIGWIAVAAAAVGCAGAPAAPAPPRLGAAAWPGAPAAQAPLGGVVGDYAVRFDGPSGVLSVEARFGASAGAAFYVDRGADTFVLDATAAPDRADATFERVAHHGRAFEARACGAGACRVRYRFDLRAAARELDDIGTAIEEGQVFEAPPSTWLLAPTAPDRDALVRFRVSTTEPYRFVTGVFPSRAAPGAWDISLDDLWTSPYSAFGKLRVREVAATQGTIHLAIAPGALAISDEQLVQWASDSARAVSGYFGRFPMSHACVLLVPGRGPWVGSGMTLAGGGGSIFMRVGETATWPSYHEDWVLVHEMTHLAFPTAPQGAQWAEEGLATYVEPFARVRAGLLSEEEAWRGLAEGMPNGLPAPGDRGLDHTPTWGRTYWGGALFFFLADIGIHERTGNARGLEHALRGILAEGGNDAVRWPLERIFAAGDRAVGAPVLTELHAKMGDKPYPVDVPAMLASLGVEVTGRRVRFDPKAPRAEIRRAITFGR
jgi:predicted metalloprotease with PDZ domain